MERKVNETQTIETNLSGMNAIRMSVAMSGMTLSAAGALISLTIIGAIIGIPMIMVGSLLALMNVPKHDVKCINCNHINTIDINTETLICKQCDTATPLNWIN